MSGFRVISSRSHIEREGMSMENGPWWSRFTALQLAIATAALVVVVAAIWVSAPDLTTTDARCTIAYLAVMGLWATRRVAGALAAALEEQTSGQFVGSLLGRVIEATLLPLYCASVLLMVGLVVLNVTEAWRGMFLWYGLVRAGGVGLLGLMASAIVLLCIWRRQQSAGWVAVTVAQALGGVVIVVNFFLATATLPPLGDHPTWYVWHVNPEILWLGYVVITALLGVFAIGRLSHLLENEGGFPWATLVFLLVFLGYLAGFSRLTGFWLSSWFYGAFMMARILTYVIFLFEPKDGPAWRSGWFACGAVAILMCTVATVHTMLSGDFAMMMQPLLMEPAPAAPSSGSPMAFGPSLMLATIRDVLFLLLLARRWGGWGEALGVILLVLLYQPIAMGIAHLGWGFLHPVLYPLSVVGLVDLFWPLAMIGLLVALLVRSRRDYLETNSLA
jgi:hypothetical protein